MFKKGIENLLLFGGFAGIVTGLGTYFACHSNNLPEIFYEYMDRGSGVDLANLSLSSVILGAVMKYSRKRNGDFN